MIRIASLTLVLSLGLAAGTALGQEPVPKDLKWETNDDFQTFADPAAKPGGTLHDFMLSFPITLRQVGPDSNGAFRSYFDANTMSLVTMHPNTDEIVPMLATHWAKDPSGRTVYYKLDPEAKWSDGKPVTADDYLYTVEFHQSKHIVAPWYNDYYTTQIEAVKKHAKVDGQEVISVTLPVAKPDLVYNTNLSPQPRHFFGKLDASFVTKFNWKVPPTTGPYVLDEVKKGKYVVFKKQKNWWAQDKKYFKNRFNLASVKISVIRDDNVAYEHFKKGDLDYFWMPFPDVWHDKAKGPIYDNGYVHKLMAYNDAPRSDYGLYINQDFDLFKDRDVRLGFQYAMNVDKVIKQVLRGDYDRLESISRGYGKYTNTKIKARPFDLAKADEHLKKAGWVERGPDGIRKKNGRRLEATITYGQENLTPRLVVLKEEAKKAGIDLKLQMLDRAAAFKSFLEKQHQIAFMSWSTSYRPAYWEHFHSVNAHKPQTNNLTNTDNKELDKLIDEYRNSTDEARRIELAHKIQEIVHDEAAIIPLFVVPYYRIATWNWLRFPEPPGTKLTDSLEYFGMTSGGLIWYDKAAEDATRAAMKAGKKLKAVTRIDETFRVK